MLCTCIWRFTLGQRSQAGCPAQAPPRPTAPRLCACFRTLRFRVNRACGSACSTLFVILSKSMHTSPQLPPASLPAWLPTRACCFLLLGAPGCTEQIPRLDGIYSSPTMSLYLILPSRTIPARMRGFATARYGALNPLTCHGNKVRALPWAPHPCSRTLRLMHRKVGDR